VTIVRWLWHRLLSFCGLYGSASGGGYVSATPVACDHVDSVIDLYLSHGGFAEWCWRCGAARSSEYVDDSIPKHLPGYGNPWLLVGINPDAKKGGAK
jgi:hypothetical protein